MIWAILVIGLLLRLISLNQSLWLDEAINILASKNFSFFGMITQYAVADFHPPGWFVILWLWTKLFGYTEISTRIPSVIFGVLTIYIIYLLGKKLVSKKLGLLAALLLSVNPLHIYYSQEARMYALATLAVILNILLFLKLIKGEKLNLIFLILSNMLVLLSDYIAYFIYPSQFVFLMVYRKNLLKQWFLSLVAALALGIWWLPIFLKQLDVGSVASANLPTWKFVAGAFDIKTLPLTFVKFIIGRISMADKVIYGILLLPIFSLFAYLLLRGIKVADTFAKRFLIFWVAIPILVATAISFWIPVFNYFRVLFVLPGFLLLASLGAISFKKKWQYFFLSTIFLIEISAAFVYLFNPSFHRENWKGLVDFFSQKQPQLILFESSGTLPPFDYYAKGSLNARGALSDFPATSEKDIVSLSETEKDIYLVDYLVEISDPKRLVSKNLTQQGYEQIDIKNFNGVGFVYHYVK